MIKKEVDYYDEIAKELANQFQSNLDGNIYSIKPLIGEISAGLRTLIVNGYETSESLKSYSHSVHRLHLDIAILVENKSTRKFEIVIFEIKRVSNLGLTELSQLIGYCLVSKSKFGVLVNVDKAVSREFSIILDGDKDLTLIKRVFENSEMMHRFGIMVWNSETLKFEYTNSGQISTIPMLIELVASAIR